ncbi:hypothetical protein [Persicirhabdus sediminis]|uniref:Polyisoprenoid-binding protein YceI n=1 Tax=Persicirhabdus sediminis TaxID=454144 RepID=A0A8J7MG21_9BACT|nr:hypothetical protein [Persicirhabdus sediminis]MBK1791149.1 hypothetical protein [Persicirhabdus sediminis]
MKSSNLFVKRLKSVVLSVIVASPVLALAEAPKLKTWKKNDVAFGSLATALKIRDYSGTFTSDSEFSSVSLNVAFFKNGVLAKNRTIGSAVSDRSQKSSEGEIAVQIVDLDYLNIKESPSDTMRFHISLSSLGMWASGQRDIPKSVFDCTESLCSSGRPDGSYKGVDGIGNILFYLMSSKTDSSKGANNLEELLKLNPHSDIAVVYLTFEE